MADLTKEVAHAFNAFEVSDESAELSG